MGSSDLLYKIILLVHLVLVVAGFGSNLVSSFLVARARGLDVRGRAVLAHASRQLTSSQVIGPVVLTGVAGILLVLTSPAEYSFAETWISLAFLLWIAVVAVLLLLVVPNAKAIDALATTLAGRTGTAGGPPPEVAELDERDRKAAMFTGIVHLLWLLLMIDMIWKPGVGS